MRAFAWFLLLLAGAFVAVALLAYPAWLLLHLLWRLLHLHFEFAFHRVGERVGMLALLLGFIAVARRLRLADRASLGYGLPRRAFLREAGLAFVLGLASLLAVVAFMAALGLLEATPATNTPASAVARLGLVSALSALAVALIEETFLRGAMHTAIERESGTAAAVVLTAILYAATHFFAKVRIPPEYVTPLSGLELITGTLHAFAHPTGIADAFLALTAVGVVLGLVRAATGNIAACIGLHAGWVWVMLVAHGLTHPNSSARLGFLLSRFDGFVGWLVLAWTVLLALPLWRFYAARAARATRGS